MEQRLFTLAEAQALLPQVRALAEAMQAQKRAFDDAATQLNRAGSHAPANGHAHGGALDADAHARTAAAELQAAVAHLAELGVEVKGIEDGLVDFPSEREGRVVYLCWRLGEEAIGWWHEVDAGFRGRRRLP